MNKKQLILAWFVIVMFIFPVFAQNKDFNPFPNNKGTIYEYGDDIPDVCFFPTGKARWNGYEVAASDWKMLTDYQKATFISEGIRELKYKKEVNSGDILKTLNEKVSDTPDMPMINLLRDTLKETKGDI